MFGEIGRVVTEIVTAERDRRVRWIVEFDESSCVAWDNFVDEHARIDGGRDAEAHAEDGVRTDGIGLLESGGNDIDAIDERRIGHVD